MMQKRRVLMLTTILLLLPLFICVVYHQGFLYDAMELSSKSDGKMGLIQLCMRDWSAIPLVVMCFSGSMLLSLFLMHFPPQKQYQRVIAHIAITVYTLLFIPMMFFNRYAIFMLESGFIVAAVIILLVLANLMVYFRSIQYGVSILSGFLVVWGLMICIVNITQGARSFDFIAAGMLTPAVLLLRGLLCPNSRIASVVAVAVAGWSSCIIVTNIIWYLGHFMRSFNIFVVIYFLAIIALPLSLVCLIIDTIMVWRLGGGI